jgi:hypothetical protein
VEEEKKNGSEMRRLVMRLGLMLVDDASFKIGRWKPRKPIPCAFEIGGSGRSKGKVANWVLIQHCASLVSIPGGKVLAGTFPWQERG